MPFVIYFDSLCFRLLNLVVFDLENILIALVIDSSIMLYSRTSLNGPPKGLRKSENNVAQPTDTATAQVCYYHHNYGEKARLCSEPCSYYVSLGQREVENIALSHSKLLYVADKGHKCRYLIDTGEAVSVLPKSCANGISGTDSLPLVAANNSTIKTYGNCKRVVDVGLKREYPWTFIVADVQQPIIGADFLIHYNLLVDLRSRCLRDMRTGLAIAASLSLIKPLSLNRVDTVQNEYTKLLGQFPELTHPTTKGEPIKHGITHKIVTKGHPVFTRPRRSLLHVSLVLRCHSAGDNVGS